MATTTAAFDTGEAHVEPGPQIAGKTLPQKIITCLTTTDHKVIGNLYFVTTMAWFIIGGLMALVIRAELFTPGLQVVDQSFWITGVGPLGGMTVLDDIEAILAGSK